jgi:hypothetical protein
MADHDDQHNVTFYDVPALEALNLWQNLGIKAAALGFCTP